MSTRLDPNVITEKELAALKQFRERIPDILENFNVYKRHDVWLLKWLRARDLDTKKAEIMLRKYMEYRKQNLEGILEWQAPESIAKHYPLKVSGFDRDGCQITVIPAGKWDIRRIATLGLASDFLLYTGQLFEIGYQLLERNSTKEKMLTQIVLILDYEGFPFSQLTSQETIELCIKMLRIFEDNHPEGIKEAFVVNAPKIFEIFFAIVKPLLTMRTLSKIRMFGCNTRQWRAAILENIDPDQLPSHYGGSITTCKDYVAAYGLDAFPVYEVLPENEMISVTVVAGLKHLVDFELSQGSKDYDIGFSVFYSKERLTGTTSLDKVELFPFAVVDSHFHLQKGMVEAEKSGFYTLVFDNTFSKFRSKELSYVARVDSPTHL